MTFKKKTTTTTKNKVSIDVIRNQSKRKETKVVDMEELKKLNKTY